MKPSLDLDLLKNLLQNPNKKKLNEAFQIFIDYLESFLDINPLSSPVTLIFNDKKEQEKYNLSNIFDFGIENVEENIIEVYRQNEEFLIFILFRTANYMFFPKTVMKNLYLKIIVNLFIENQLKEVENINNWKNFIRKAIVDLDGIYFGLQMLEKIFKTLGNYSKFVKYIWNNIKNLDPEDYGFFFPFFNRYADYTLEEIQDENILETIRVISKIFDRIKSYRALLDYQNYFKEFIEKDILKTDLSLRKFTSNLQKFQMLSIAPTYQVNWHTLNISNNYFFLKFHPMIKLEKISKIIEKFPFLIAPKISQSSFAFEVSGFIIIPKVYLDDLFTLFQKLEQKGYVIKQFLFDIDVYGSFTNLNFFREKFKNRRLINPNHRDYETKYELQFKIEYGRNFYKKTLSLEDFLILDKIRYYSYTGFGFERRTNTLQKLKEDFLIEYSKQESNVTELQRILGIFHSSIEIKEKFFKFLNKFIKFGFLFFNDLLNNIIIALKLIQDVFIKNRHLVTSAQFLEYVKRNGVSFLIEENLIFNNQYIRNSLYRDFIPLYQKSSAKYEREIKKFELYKDLLNICKELMIFDLGEIRNLIDDPDVSNKVYHIKKEKLKTLHKKVKERDITSNYVEDKLDKYASCEPPTIVPNIQASIPISNFGRYFPFLLIKNTPETNEIIRVIKSFFPRMDLWQILDLQTNKLFTGIEFYGLNLINKEKELLFASFYNLFKNGIILGKRFFWKGAIFTFTMRNFYDFSQKQFFYTPKLYKEFFLYIQKIFGNQIKGFRETNFNLHVYLWKEEKNILNLLAQASPRREDFILNDLNYLKEVYLKLKDFLLKQKKFEELKLSLPIKEYVKSISYIPIFNYFGFSQYYLYLRPINPSSIDLKLLFINTFQSIKFIGSIGDSISFLIKYFFPIETPNKSFLNWHLYSAKNISEFCMFNIKKIHNLFHLEPNFTEDGWDFDVNNFKKYIQNILFNPSKKRIKPEKVEFNFKRYPRDDCLGPESLFYKNLTDIYDTTSINIKSLRLKYDDSKLKKIRKLIREELIFPYIKLENIGLPEKITFIIPGIKKEDKENLIDIFSFFNLVKIYEIEGEFYIYGFSKERKFEDGLMVKIYFPFKNDIFRFLEQFNLLFEFLQIDYFLVIDSIFDGKALLKHVYGNLDFLKEYNPLKNLKWNEKDKIWMNHKLFNEKFEPIYPDLNFKDNK
ncbi:MAG: hypothetical protein ACFFCY_04550 [Promethearchaeota archaeon]